MRLFILFLVTTLLSCGQSREEKFLREMAEKMRSQELIDLKLLENSKAEFEKSQIEIKKFQITRSVFHREEKIVMNVSMGKEPVIEIEGKNGTPYAIATAYLTGTIQSPERSVPWLREDFSFDIAGGVEPGEIFKVRLTPNPFSEWGRVDAPSNAIFTAEPRYLKNAKGEYLYRSSFSKLESDRLKELKEKYGR